MNNPTTDGTCVLVTGGAGYIGSHACKALAKAGYRPVVYDNLSRGHVEAVRWGPLETGDLLEADRLNEVFESYRPAAVMHFAALAYVGESVTQPQRYYHNNVVGSFNLLNAMLRHGTEQIVFSSSCVVYGTPEKMPISEDLPHRPINPYGRTKSMVEQMLQDLSRTQKLRYVALRYFNAAGADTGGELGEDHDPETHLIPLVLQTAAGIKPFVEIYGNDYPTPDGTCIRDYIHVTDLADAHVRALSYLEQGNESDAFNLGVGAGVSVQEIVDHARRITGNDLQTRPVARREGDPPCLIADAARSRSKLLWSPRQSDIDTIITTAWNWHRRLSSV